ncbi:MAG: hypothetical protein HQK53_02725 [Oligoflexia bacterium]|nr:hypothetical protein [Oligoflexia bacterium]
MEKVFQGRHKHGQSTCAAHSRYSSFSLLLRSTVLGSALSLSLLGATIGSAVAAEYKSKSFHDDLVQLKKAMIFTIPESKYRDMDAPMLGKEELRQEIIREIDTALVTKVGAAELARLRTPGNESELLQARKATMKELAVTNRYWVDKDQDPTVVENEIWRRQQSGAHQIVLDAQRVNPRKGEVIEYNLTAAEVPYGGNYFPDNYGGITRRWAGSLWGAFADYYTLFEESWSKLSKETWSSVRNLDKHEMHQLKLSCSELNNAKRQITSIEREIDRAMEVSNNLHGAEKTAIEQQIYVQDKKVEDLAAHYPALFDLMHIHTKLDEVLGKTDCYQLLHYDDAKGQAIEVIKQKLRDMPQKEFDELSPTEKYDIMNGFYDFRTTNFEKVYKGKKRKNRNATEALLSKHLPWLSSFNFIRGWEGRCNADRACGISNRFDEPTHNVSMPIEELGKVLTFMPLDSKALLMATYFNVENDKYAQLGDRTYDVVGHDPNPNPAILDILLRSLFMKYKVPFVFDNHNNYMVNNVTAIGFKRVVKNIWPIREFEKRKIIAKMEKTLQEKNLVDYNAAAGELSWQNPRSYYERVRKATKVMRVETEIRILSELKMEYANRPTKALIAADKIGTKRESYIYDLYLTDENEIVEGELLPVPGKNNMDFLWFTAGKGTQEFKADGDPYLQYNIISQIAKHSAQAHSDTIIERLHNQERE